MVSKALEKDLETLKAQAQQEITQTGRLSSEGEMKLKESLGKMKSLSEGLTGEKK